MPTSPPLLNGRNKMFWNKKKKFTIEDKQKLVDKMEPTEYEIPRITDKPAGIGNLVRAMMVDAPNEMKQIDGEIQKHQQKIEKLRSQKQILKAGYDAMLVAEKSIK